jgi:hypothetical protein
VPRFLSTVLVVALLGGTAAAFAVTQGLKIEPSPITAPRIAKVFSPTCDCETHVASIRFRLRKPDRVRLQIVDDNGRIVRTLVPGRRLRRGTVSYTWNGRDDQGRFVPSGVYKPRVHLADQHRTIDLPNDMQVDTTAPTVLALRASATTISPDGDGKADRLTLSYRLSERAHALLFVNGRQHVFTRGQKPVGNIVWNGIAGKSLPPGRYVLAVAAQDTAGNVGPRRSLRVRIRYVDLARKSLRAKAGTRFGVRVLSDGATKWRFAGKVGDAKPGVLVLRAPVKAGRYSLSVWDGPYGARASVDVSAR